MASKVSGFFTDPVTFKARPKETSNSFAKIIKVALGAIAIIASYIFFVPEVATGIAATIVILLSLFNIKRPSSDDSSREPVLSNGRKRYVSTLLDMFRRGSVRTSDDLPSRRVDPPRDGSHVENCPVVREDRSGAVHRAPAGGSASSRESADWRGSPVSRETEEAAPSGAGSPASSLPRTPTATRASAAAREARRESSVSSLPHSTTLRLASLTKTRPLPARTRTVIREDRSGAVHRASAGGKK